MYAELDCLRGARFERSTRDVKQRLDEFDHRVAVRAELLAIAAQVLRRHSTDEALRERLRRLTDARGADDRVWRVEPRDRFVLDVQIAASAVLNLEPLVESLAAAIRRVRVSEVQLWKPHR